MDKLWRFNWFPFPVVYLLVSIFLHEKLDFVCCLNDEGLALLRFRERVIRDPFDALSNWKVNDKEEEEENPCFWFGIECSNGKVVSLVLNDLSLEGTLAPEIRNLVHIKSIILRNNLFFGVIPEGVGELKELKVLDLGYNNLCGPIPFNLDKDISLAILLLDNNKILSGVSTELHVDKNQQTYLDQGNASSKKFNKRSIEQLGDVAYRRLLRVVDDFLPIKPKAQTSIPTHQTQSPSPSPSPPPSHSLSVSPTTSLPLISSIPFLLPFMESPAPTPHLSAFTPIEPPFADTVEPPTLSAPIPSSSPSPSQSDLTSARSKRSVRWPIISVAIGASFVVVFLIMILLYRSQKVVGIKPWVTGLSGQLQKAFVTGVPKLKRSDLVTACEDFSNIIDSSADGTMYKGTLSSGVEIAVTSTAVASVRNWSKKLEGQYRKKIEVLSKVNHKNFVNLLGFCVEEKPFTRMMVFEYAPNGTLFEHLHIKEAEHLDWKVRLRIAMGMAYCLGHLHQLNPPIFHDNLQSNSVYLSEDYAAKISDAHFLSVTGLSGAKSIKIPSPDSESNIYSFGVILLEMITGRLPYSQQDGSLVDWASVYMRKERPVRDMIDPTLKHFDEEEIEKLCEVIRSCINVDPKQRLSMREVTAQLREITGITPDVATPKLSPLWWAELEIVSVEAT